MFLHSSLPPLYSSFLSILQWPFQGVWCCWKIVLSELKFSCRVDWFTLSSLSVSDSIFLFNFSGWIWWPRFLFLKQKYSLNSLLSVVEFHWILFVCKILQAHKSKSLTYLSSLSVLPLELTAKFWQFSSALQVCSPLFICWQAVSPTF